MQWNPLVPPFPSAGGGRLAAVRFVLYGLQWGARQAELALDHLFLLDDVLILAR